MLLACGEQPWAGSCSGSCCTWPTRWRAGAGGTRSSPRHPRARARAGATRCWPGSRAPARAGSCPRAGATRCACCCLRRRVPEGGCPLVAGTLVAEGAGELIVGLRAARRSALAIGVGPAIGLSATTGSIAAALAAALGAACAARAAARSASAPWRPGWPRGCAPLRWPGPTRAHVLPVAAREPRLPARRARLLPRRLRPTRDARRRAAGRVRAVQRAARAVLARLGRRRRRDPRRHLRARDRHRRPAAQLAAFFVGTSTVLTVVGTALALAICCAARSGLRRRPGRASAPRRPALMRDRAPAASAEAVARARWPTRPAAMSNTKWLPVATTASAIIGPHSSARTSRDRVAHRGERRRSRPRRRSRRAGSGPPRARCRSSS